MDKVIDNPAYADLKEDLELVLKKKRTEMELSKL